MDSTTLSDHRAALELLRGARRVLLTGHEHPDGDCIGAQAALYSVLDSLGKQVTILNPHVPEARYDYLTRACAYGVFGGQLPTHDLAVLLDCSELDRCGAMAPALEASASPKLVVDHHIHAGEPWWDAAYTDSSAAATGLLVHRIAAEMGADLDEVARKGVFTSIVTDTGWFKYSNTDAETLRVASELVGAGLDPSEMYREIYQRRPSDHPRTVGRILDRLEYHAGGRLAIVDVPMPAGGEDVESEDVLDLLRSVDGVEVVLLLRDLGSGNWKLSARSKTDYDVNALARRFGGGGHMRASGATLRGNLDEVRSRIVSVAVEELGRRQR